MGFWTYGMDEKGLKNGMIAKMREAMFCLPHFLEL